jgi:hypothetical protein
MSIKNAEYKDFSESVHEVAKKLSTDSNSALNCAFYDTHIELFITL